MRTAILITITCAACSSDPATSTSDAGTTDTGAAIDSGSALDAPVTADATDASAQCELPSEPNSLAGEFSVGSGPGSPAWKPKAVYRIERAKDPAHPQILFLSTAVDCSALKEEGYDGRIPTTDMLFLELGAAAAGTYTASSASPPPSTGAYVYTWGSHVDPYPPPPIQYSRSGAVTVTAYETAMARGTFFADFVTDPPTTVRVCGRFEATPCAVNW
jgi:hypothetical protein